MSRAAAGGVERLASLRQVEFEIQGKVQGVFFRKHTKAKAETLGIVGWVANTESGSVVGALQGPARAVEQMKEWLSRTGSPKSKITSATFTADVTITGLTYRDFAIRK